MEYHDNVVKLEFNKGKLCEDNLGCFGYFEVKDFCITEGQDPDGKIKVGNKYSINNEGQIVFSVGRKGSEKVAKWLSEQMGVSACSVSKWCNQKAQPDLETLNKIAKVLNVNMKDLLADSKIE